MRNPPPRPSLSNVKEVSSLGRCDCKTQGNYFTPTSLPQITVIDYIIEETHIKKLVITVI